MGFRGNSKNQVGTFFTGHRRNIRQIITDFANTHFSLPTLNEFITELDTYIRNSSAVSIDIKNTMTLANMQSDPELMQAKFDEVARGIEPPQRASPSPAPAPAASSSAPRFSGAYLADNGMGDSKGRLIREQGMNPADASHAVSTRDLEGTLIGSDSRGSYLHKTKQSTSEYSVKDKRFGGDKATFLYRKEGAHTFFVGMAHHIKPPKGQKSAYRVVLSLIDDLEEGDTLLFQ